MRGVGYSEKEVSDSYAYFCVDTFWQAKAICEEGFTIGNANTSCLGNPELGNTTAMCNKLNRDEFHCRIYCC